MVESGMIAVVHYVGRIAEGTDEGRVFDTSDVDVALESGTYQGSRDYVPIEFEVGSGDALPGIEAVVEEMAVGEERIVELDPGAAYGEYDPDRVVTVPRDELEANSDVEAAVDEIVTSEDGDVGWIIAVGDDTVTIDFNHELAGETLEFELRVIDAYESTENGTNPGG